MSTIKELQYWYSQCCNGEWEQDYGIKIETLDNPGWRVEINLCGTKYASREIGDTKIERNEEDWVHYSVKKSTFYGYGGPNNLDEVLRIFIEAVVNSK
jgi:hypothetical protein